MIIWAGEEEILFRVGHGTSDEWYDASVGNVEGSVDSEDVGGVALQTSH